MISYAGLKASMSDKIVLYDSYTILLHDIVGSCIVLVRFYRTIRALDGGFSCIIHHSLLDSLTA